MGRSRSRSFCLIAALVFISGALNAESGHDDRADTPPPALVEKIQHWDPSLSGFGRYSKTPINERYALLTVYASTGATEPMEGIENRLTRQMKCAVIAEDDMPILLLDTLGGGNRGYRVDRISDDQVTFLVDDDFYRTWLTKVKLFFDLNSRTLFGIKE